MRRVTSLTVVAAFVVLIVTSLAMELSPHSPGAGPGGPQLNASSDVRGIGGGAGPGPGPGPGRRAHSFFPKKLHEIAGYVMMVAGVIHLAFNYKVLLSYLGLTGRRARERRDGLAEGASS